MAGDDLAIDFNPLHTLGFVVTDWIEAHCHVPGGVFEGESLVLNGWQLYCAANHYRVKPGAAGDQRRLVEPFVYRRYLDYGALDGLREGGMSVTAYVFAFLFYLVQYFVIFFFNSALVGAAMIRLDGGDPTLRDGLRIAAGKALPILGYAAIAATVGTVGER